jgi:hypothetical protein
MRIKGQICPTPHLLLVQYDLVSSQLLQPLCFLCRATHGHHSAPCQLCQLDTKVPSATCCCCHQHCLSCLDVGGSLQRSTGCEGGQGDRHCLGCGSRDACAHDG